VPTGHPLHKYRVIIGDILRGITFDIQKYAFEKTLEPLATFDQAMLQFPVKKDTPQVLKLLEDIFKGPFDSDQPAPTSELILTVSVPKVDYVIQVESTFTEEPVAVGAAVPLTFKIKTGKSKSPVPTKNTSKEEKVYFTYEVFTDQNWVLSGKKKSRFDYDVEFQVTAIPLQTGRLKPPKLDITTTNSIKMEVDYRASHDFISIVSHAAVSL
jgi:hypothetical protein